MAKYCVGIWTGIAVIACVLDMLGKGSSVQVWASLTMVQIWVVALLYLED